MFNIKSPVKTKMKTNWLLLYSVVIVSLSSCLSDDGANSKLNEEIKQIDDYLASTGVTENVLYDNQYGMRIHVHEYGDFAPPHDGQDVTINFVGKLFSNGTTFSSGVITDKVQSLNPLGLRETVRSMMTGSNVTAYIPSSRGFGSAGANGVPPDAILVYDIYLAHTERTPTEKAQFTKDSTAIVNYIEENQLDHQYREGDVWLVVDQPGVGSNATPYDVVTLDYKLSLLSDPGTVVEESTIDQQSVFGLIDGFKVALPMINEGAKARLIIPSILAYGVTGISGIPSNAVLIYEISLTDIHK